MKKTLYLITIFALLAVGCQNKSVQESSNSFRQEKSEHVTRYPGEFSMSNPLGGLPVLDEQNAEAEIRQYQKQMQANAERRERQYDEQMRINAIRGCRSACNIHENPSQCKLSCGSY